MKNFEVTCSWKQAAAMMAENNRVTFLLLFTLHSLENNSSLVGDALQSLWNFRITRVNGLSAEAVSNPPVYKFFFQSSTTNLYYHTIINIMSDTIISARAVPNLDELELALIDYKNTVDNLLKRTEHSLHAGDNAYLAADMGRVIHSLDDHQRDHRCAQTGCRRRNGAVALTGADPRLVEQLIHGYPDTVRRLE